MRGVSRHRDVWKCGLPGSLKRSAVREGGTMVVENLPPHFFAIKVRHVFLSNLCPTPCFRYAHPGKIRWKWRLRQPLRGIEVTKSVLWRWKKCCIFYILKARHPTTKTMNTMMFGNEPVISLSSWGCSGFFPAADLKWGSSSLQNLHSPYFSLHCQPWPPPQALTVTIHTPEWQLPPRKSMAWHC